MNNDLLTALCNLTCVSFILTKNNHATYYETVAQCLKQNVFGRYDNVPDDEKERMRQSNTMWELQVYWNTPVGFNLYVAATLESVVEQALADT